MKRSLQKMTSLLLLLFASTARGQEPVDCGLDPDLVKISERCVSDGETATPACAAFRVLDLLFHGQRAAAAESLTQDFGYPEATRDHVFPFLEFLAAMMTDENAPAECFGMRITKMTQWIEDATSESKDPEYLAVVWRILEYPEGMIGKVEERLDPKTADAVEKLTTGLLELLKSSPQAHKFLFEGLKNNPVIRAASGEASPPMEGMDAGLHRIDEAMQLARQTGLRDARQAVSDALAAGEDPIHKAKLLTRAGISFITAQFLEDAVDVLLQADQVLADQGDDPSAVTLRHLARWYLVAAYRQLGLPDQAERILASDEPLPDNDLGKVLKAIKGSIIEPQILPALKMMDQMFSGQMNLEEIKPLMAVLEDVTPWVSFDASSNPDSARASGSDDNFVQEMMRLIEPILIEGSPISEAAVLDFVGRYPRYNHAFLPLATALRLWQSGDREGAFRMCDEAIADLEAQVETFRVDELQTAFVQKHISPAFEQAVEMAAQDHRTEKAFNYAERGRAWTLRRLLGSPRSPETSTTAESAWQLLPGIRAAEAALRKAREDLDRTQTSQRENELARLRGEFVTKRLEQKITAAGEHGLATVQSTSLPNLQSSLDSQTAILVYAAGSDHLWAWVITQESVEMESLGAREELRMKTLIQSLRGSRGTRPVNLPGGQAAAELYQRLIAPLTEYLEGRSKLIVVPFGVLHHLPFAALHHANSYLIEDFTLSLAPSASALALILRSDAATGGSKALVLGDPVSIMGSLQGAQREAKSVADLVRTTPLLEGAATEAAVWEEAHEIALLHLAAHAEYVEESPLFSRIWLSSGSGHDGLLEVHEIWDRLDLRNARLVTLAGCQTALGELTRGDEVVGLTQAFLVAGSRAVLSTLWLVHDKASEELMVAFYRRLLSGSPAPEALRDAQLELLHGGEFADPYYWAGFTLTGDPGVHWHVDSTGAPAGGLGQVLVLVSFLGIVFAGFALPPRFPPQLGVVLSPEEDMSEGDYHRIRSQRGTRSGFFRPAKVYISSDFRLLSRSDSALACLYANRQGVSIRAMKGQTLWEQTLDGEWKRVPEGKQRVRRGAVYRDHLGRVFFQLHLRRG